MNDTRSKLRGINPKVIKEATKNLHSEERLHVFLIAKRALRQERGEQRMARYAVRVNNGYPTPGKSMLQVSNATLMIYAHTIRRESSSGIRKDSGR